MNRKIKRYILTVIAIILALAIFGSGFYVGRFLQPKEKPSDILIINKELGQPETVDFSLFWKVMGVLEERYVDSSEIDYKEILYGAISGMVKSLGDPYTTFLKPQESKTFLENVKGAFGGVGIEIGLRKGVLTVIAPLEGTPADEAGMKAGDKIIKVDDTLTTDLTLDEAVNLIRGEPGTEIILTIVREGLEGTKEIKIIRDIIQIPVLRWEVKDNDIAYIKLHHFTESMIREFRKAVGEILASDAEKIILDLRNNPGGYLEVAVDIASWFIPNGEIVAIEDFGEGKQKTYRSEGYRYLQDFPIVVLVNKGSASASEIVAGALRDIKGVKLVGETTFGKGSIQELVELKDGSFLKITIAKWLIPSGISISEEGLEPDVKIELTQEDIDEERDPQLDKAIELLK